ncbi:methylmalonyl-CoA mutase family protein [Phascolarctobacterium succinatutens]|uniref:methylmalonyl-CoA mutase family protein n=1 Tax=Phascolarctobacterium succinatutens TaxID=626940 RepID=UPI00248FC0F8|nr:methylmalonyl-CoA mutase family protein [Phascolarctobacterium succinatutens]
MLDATRLRTPCLFDKIVSADEAATLITDGMNVGVSGFTPSGYPKKTTLALAKAIKAGKKCRINIWSGASVGPEIEETLAEVGGISGRMPYYAASNKTLSRQINTGSVTYIDQHLSHFAQQIDYGFYGDVDVAIVEAAAINADGSIVLGSGIGNTPILVKHAKKIIVEVNTSIPLTLEGMHDIYICSKPPERTEIPIYHVGDRIGSPYVSCGLDRITCIVESDIVDHVRNFSAPDDTSKKIAANLVDFLEHEQRHGRLPQQMLPLQSGVGSIANAVLMGLAESKFENLTMYSEILQDSVFKLIKCGKVTQASGCAFTPSPTVWEMYKEDPELYRNRIVLRPLDISNNPEVIRRLGVISMNTPLEFDIYGQANSTHVMGNRMMNGIGGSGDYMRNGYLTIFSTPSTAKGGNISSVVPMVSHADHTEHDTMVFITEQGVADIRGLSPLKGEMAAHAYEYQTDIEKGKRTVIGVNKFADNKAVKTNDVITADLSVAERQIARVNEMKAHRDQHAVDASLKALKEAANGEANLMPYLIDAVKTYATLGEICGVLREVFGEYQQGGNLF